MSLRGAQRRGNLKEQKGLVLNERSPHPHSRVRDDMRYTMVVQQYDKLEFENGQVLKKDRFLRKVVRFGYSLKIETMI